MMRYRPVSDTDSAAAEADHDVTARLTDDDNDEDDYDDHYDDYGYTARAATGHRRPAAGAINGSYHSTGSYESFGTEDLASAESDVSLIPSESRMTKCQSMPCGITAPSTAVQMPFDPFPELSRHKMAPVSARLYQFRFRPPSDAAVATSDGQQSMSSMEPARNRSPAADDPVNVTSLRSSSSSSANAASHYATQMRIAFHNDDQSQHTLTVDGWTTVAQVCEQLMQSNHAAHSPHWTVVERLARCQLERGVEHHELVCPIYNSWTSADEGRFYFRQDFTKFELFRSPTQFFPEHMVETKLSTRDDTGGLLTHSERYKNLLLQNLLANQSIPDIQGHVHIREGKRSWKKYFCVLRGSGLYCSTKNCQKEPQYLTLLSALDDVNIYTALSVKKVFNAPTHYGFCLRPAEGVSDGQQMKWFCVEDEQARLCWITGMRFVKYGSQLRENLRLSLKCEDSTRDCDDETSADGLSSGPLYVKSRVAMDFSGEHGRVVADPNEALGVAFEEGYNWRKKAALRNMSVAARVTSDGLSDTRDFLPPPRPCSMMPVHTNQPWFLGNIGRDNSVALLADHGLVDGVFLVRNSESIPNVFVLSFIHNQKVKHCTIRKFEVDGLLYYSLDGGNTRFMDLIQLVDFYKLNAGVLPTKLHFHVTRLL